MQDELDALKRIQADLDACQVDEYGLRIPILSGQGEGARALERELGAVIKRVE